MWLCSAHITRPSSLKNDALEKIFSETLFVLTIQLGVDQQFNYKYHSQGAAENNWTDVSAHFWSHCQRYNDFLHHGISLRSASTHSADNGIRSKPKRPAKCF